MGQDSVKHFYPFAWAVVDRETSRTWKWFIELLRNSLDLADEEFHDQLKVMGAVSKQAAKDLVWYPAQNWCRAYFDTVCKNHSCENNFTESFNKWILEARAKPIIKMLENIRIKIMNRLQKLEEEGKNWKGDFSPYVMELYNDFNIIAQCCQVQSNGDQGYEVVEGEDRHVVNLNRKKCTCRTWDLTGIPCPHAIKAYLHDKQEPLDQGEKFWKVDPSHAMEPPEIHKLVGRPKLKRKRENDEARKREGVWSASRKGLKMTCGHCSATGHNQRRCHMSSQPAGPSNSNKIEKKPIGPSKSKRKIVVDESEDEQHVAPSSAVADKDRCEHESEDEQTIVRPKAISEARTRHQAKKIQIRPTGTRRIDFKGHDNGVSIPTNLPYSPRKLAWKGKETMTSNQLTVEKETRIGKLNAKKGKESTNSDKLTVEKEKRIGKLKAKRGGKK
ncbi:hypothetical protein MTR67_023206 [Solanum verrucosum]|uniref:SWIM-type domain-containing protein n=1 Tax=Solanum verrucosum TaxID=315347 RepID=A0AAF0QUS0_SOLVR|nr:hypothetical protein MTR67_023206 [Solanum verrucosum]